MRTDMHTYINIYRQTGVIQKAAFRIRGFGGGGGVLKTLKSVKNSRSIFFAITLLSPTAYIRILESKR
jgi:hypothetical protein